MTGRVLRLVRERGFGFLVGDDGVERFFHRSGVQQSSAGFEQLREQQAVEFIPLDDAPKGPRAIEVIERRA
jgi:cold shock CspA family protein